MNLTKKTSNMDVTMRNKKIGSIRSRYYREGIPSTHVAFYVNKWGGVSQIEGSFATHFEAIKAVNEAYAAAHPGFLFE